MEAKSGLTLKLVIAVRHGIDRLGGGLTEQGVIQMNTLAATIKVIVASNLAVSIFSSPISRAQQSAKIIAEQLGLTVEICDELRHDEFDDGPMQIEALLKKNHAADVIVAVTHSEAPSGIINAFSQRFFRREVKSEESGNGDGFMICLKTGKVSTSVLLSETAPK